MLGKLLSKLKNDDPESRYDAPTLARAVRSEASKKRARTIRRYVEQQRRDRTPQSNQLSS